MSGIISSTPNYGGRQPENTAYIKQFVSSDTGLAVWVYKKIQNSLNVFITPADQNKNVLIPKDLTVLGSINNPSDISLKHDIVPKPTILTTTEVDELNKKYAYDKLSLISRFDPVSRAICLRPGQVVKFIRPSETSIRSNYYRKCVEQ